MGAVGAAGEVQVVMMVVVVLVVVMVLVMVMVLVVMMMLTIIAMHQVDLSDKSFEHRLGEVRKLWQQITDKTPAGTCAHTLPAHNFCDNMSRDVSRGVGERSHVA